MNLEHVFAVIGAVVVAAVITLLALFLVALVLVVGATVWCRIRSGQWWWDEVADGLESGQ